MTLFYISNRSAAAMKVRCPPEDGKAGEFQDPRRTRAGFLICSTYVDTQTHTHKTTWLAALCDHLSAADEDSWSEMMCSYPSQPIHLWQFLRELLLKPHNYSRCIRWLNKEKGELH